MAFTGKTIKLNNKYYTYTTVFIKVFYVNCTVNIRERIYVHLIISLKLCLTTTHSTHPHHIMLQPELAVNEDSLEACTNTHLAIAPKEAVSYVVALTFSMEIFKKLGHLCKIIQYFKYH